MNANLYVIEDYENETTFRPKKQTQSNPIHPPFVLCPLPSAHGHQTPFLAQKQGFATKIRKNPDSIGICNNSENR